MEGEIHTSKNVFIPIEHGNLFHTSAHLHPRKEQICSQRCASKYNSPHKKFWIHPLGIVQNFEDRHVVQPTKNTRDTLPYPLATSVDLPWLETAHFQKCMYKVVQI